MEDFVRKNPRSEWADHAIYWMAQIYIQKEEFGLAEAELQRRSMLELQRVIEPAVLKAKLALLGGAEK